MLDVSQNFKDTVYAPVRQFNARIHFTLSGNTVTYDDETIIKINILEEMNTINNTLPSNEITVTLDNSDGAFNFLKLSNMQEIIASRPKIEVEFGLVNEKLPYLSFYQIDYTQEIEWVPVGTYYLTEWKNERESRSISLIGRDHFDYLSGISYDNLSSNTLYNLAVDVLQNAGITNYSVDDSLKTITTSGFKERLDSRTALQHIGIAGRAAVYDNRNGALTIKPFTALDASSNYLTYCGQSYYFGGAYPLVTNGFGMKNIDYDNMYEEPEISLDKSIYEVVVTIYEASGTRGKVYVNSAINGKYGESFSIDNPLINTESLANEVAAWIIRESNFNAIYKTNWRQNPILECADVILVEDSVEAKKQTRIYKQEYTYEGYLTGVTESRGGI
jgi:hypothetical protein